MQEVQFWQACLSDRKGKKDKSKGEVQMPIKGQGCNKKNDLHKHKFIMIYENYDIYIFLSCS